MKRFRFAAAAAAVATALGALLALAACDDKPLECPVGQKMMLWPITTPMMVGQTIGSVTTLYPLCVVEGG